MSYTKLASLLHTVLCDAPHAEEIEEVLQERDPSKCYYYLEEPIADKDLRIDHTIWEDYAREECARCKSSPEELIRMLNVLLDLRRRLEDILTKAPNAKEFVRRVLAGGLD